MPHLAWIECSSKDPYTISKNVFRVLSPLDQLAAKALEKVGKVKIVENDDIAHVG
jgi:hypothetical protein